mgnify:CR=1 FL=1
MGKEQEIIYEMEAKKKGLTAEELRVLLGKWQERLEMSD